MTEMKKDIIRLKPDCLECLLKAHLKKYPEETDTLTKLEYMKKLMQIIVDARPEDSAPTLSPEIQKLQREMFGFVADDYTEIKKYFNNLMMEKAISIEAEIKNAKDPLKLAVQYAMTGNYIDFGAVENVNEKDLCDYLEKAKEIPIDEREYKAFSTDIQNAKSIVYLTDNCGEVVMDQLLIKEIMCMNPQADLTVVVRGMDTINDATMEDALQIGLTSMVKVMGNGTGIAGTCLDKISADAKAVIEKADVLIAKGQGNFETLQMCGLNIYYIFMCKCMMFARRFQVPQFSGMLINDKSLKQM